jgi:hypothetical protein
MRTGPKTPWKEAMILCSTDKPKIKPPKKGQPRRKLRTYAALGRKRALKPRLFKKRNPSEGKRGPLSPLKGGEVRHWEEERHGEERHGEEERHEEEKDMGKREEERRRLTESIGKAIRGEKRGV